jgi:hypothetical protein
VACPPVVGRLSLSINLAKHVCWLAAHQQVSFALSEGRLTNHITSFTGLSGYVGHFEVAWAQGTVPGAVMDFVKVSSTAPLPAYFDEVDVAGNAMFNKPGLGYVFFVEEIDTAAGRAVPIEYSGICLAPDIPLCFAVDVYLRTGVTVDVDVYWHAP